MQQIGKGLHWLGSRFVAWGERLQLPAQTMELRRQL
jgi:hypothetical protein